MGISWLAEIISFELGPSTVWYISDVFNCFQASVFLTRRRTNATLRLILHLKLFQISIQPLYKSLITSAQDSQ